MLALNLISAKNAGISNDTETAADIHTESVTESDCNNETHHDHDTETDSDSDPDTELTVREHDTERLRLSLTPSLIE